LIQQQQEIIMSEPFLGEITLFAFNFPPRGWAQCDGQIVPINQYPSLFSILGVTYGGDGRTTFALPDLRGRVPMHEGTGAGLSPRLLGQKGGSEEVALTNPDQLPPHTHQLVGTNAVGGVGDPTGGLLARAAGPQRLFGDPDSPVDLANEAMTSTGGQAHANMQPYLAVNFCIAIQGVFPPRD
jgi:microcystin-dependent protein